MLRSRRCNQAVTRKIWARSMTLTSRQPSTPRKVVIQRRYQLCYPFWEHWHDVVSALAGARQVVLGNHKEYLVVQTLQFLSLHFRVAFPQPAEGRHLRGQSVFCGLFIQRPNCLESAFAFLEGERNRWVGVPPSRLGTTTFPGGALCSVGLSRCCSAALAGRVSGTPRISGGALDTCGSGVPFSLLGLGPGSCTPSPWGIRNSSLCGGHHHHWQSRRYWRGRCRCWRGRCSHWRIWWGHHGTLRWRDTGEARAPT